MKIDFLKRAGCLILCLVLALSLAAFPALAADGDGNGDGDDKTEGGGAKITAMSLSTDKMELEVGDSGRITVTVVIDPKDGNVDWDAAWTSSDENVASVNNGVVTAKSAGTATITATVGEFSAACEVTVRNPQSTAPSVSRIEFNDREILQKDSSTERRPIGVSVTPQSAQYGKIEYTSGNEDIVKITPDESDATQLSAVLDFKDSKPGETYIYASVVNASIPSAQCRVIVSGIIVSDRAGDELSETAPLTMTVGIAQNVSVTNYGDAANRGNITWYSENSAVVSVNSGGQLTPMSPGSTRVTAMRGNYTASFRVTVNENTTGLVEVTNNIPAGTPMSLSSISSKISGKFADDTEERYGESKSLSYITSLNVSPSQGVLYNGYVSEANTGSGVSMSDRFYISGGSHGGYLLSDLSFVPSSTFSGKAEISYTGVSADGSTISGVIRVTVNAMEDVSYTTGSGQNVFFRGSDFNTVCRLRTGRELSTVTFTLPPAARGTLYYNYTGNGQYSEKVEATTKYRRVGNPNLDGVSFLPADNFSGSVRISYRGTDTAGGTFTGYVTVTVTELPDDASLIFTGKAGKQVSFTTTKFNNACVAATGERLERVQFTTLPNSSEGTLYYTYGGSERKVTESMWFYRISSPYISDVYFVPAKNAPDQIRIPYTGRGDDKTVYTGTVLIDYSGTAKSDAISYTVYSGRAVQFDASDFNTACIEATGSTLNYVNFEIPSLSRGLLCYNYTSTSTPRSVSSTTRYYRSAGGGNRIDYVWFLADPAFSGTVEIPYTGRSNDGEDFSGTVSIRVNSNSPAEVRFSGAASQPIALSASQIRYACNAVMDKELSYIEFTSLPSSSQGRIYRGYTGNDTGTQVVTGTAYYVSGTPAIDQLSFVPRGGFSGVAYAGYTGVSASGERVSGQISFTVAGAGSSSYFNDMGSCSWAAPAADYLYLNGIINGVGGGRFAPNSNIMRRDFTVMICRAYNFSGGSGMSFGDVPSDSYYASAVSTASGLGIVNGDGRNFHPNSQLTRQDAMVIIKRALEAAGWSLGGYSGNELSFFGDGGSVSQYARDAVSTLVRLGAVNGDNSGNLRPRAPITRAEAAVILHYVLTM